MINTINSSTQWMPVLTRISSLPGGEGWADIYAGESKGILFCFGGVNFPDKCPWGDGKKKWYDDIYMLQEWKNWVKLVEKLPFPLAYEVSVSYKERIIIIGGNNEAGYSDKVFEHEWSSQNLDLKYYPGSPLPVLVKNGKIVFWGGVDALTALYTDPETHPGISEDILLYTIDTDSWEYAGKMEGIAARVTLPVVYWNGHWTYISGEVKPGIRSDAIYKISNN